MRVLPKIKSKSKSILNSKFINYFPKNENTPNSICGEDDYILLKIQELKTDIDLKKEILADILNKIEYSDSI